MEIRGDSWGRSGFTLVELMISMAMVLLLMAGINAVFSATQKTASMGLALSEIGRGQRAMERVLTHDFGRAVAMHETPCLVINSRQVFAFRDREDQANNGDTNPQMANLDGSGLRPIPPAIYNQRNHRVDTVGFFVRDVQTPFTRQTGNQRPVGTVSPLVVREYSKEAFIWYGHLNQPTTSLPPGQLDTDPRLRSSVATGSFFEPGEASPQNTSNYFYNDWGFGRMAMLLKLPTMANGNFIDFNTTFNPNLLAGLGKGAPAATLGGTAPTVPNLGNVSWTIENSRFDVVATTAGYYRDYLLGKVTAGPPIASTASQGVYPNIAEGMDYRFNCKPWTTRWDTTNNVHRDMTLEAALTAPLLMKGVSHIVVEFAGDFIGQNPNGSLLGGLLPGTTINRADVPDGTIDFVLLDPVNPNSSPRMIRWYGMPRYVDPTNNPMLTPLIPGGANTNVFALNSPCVVPLRDISLVAADGSVVNPWAPCEEFITVDPATKAKTGDVPIANDYVTDMQQTNAVYRAVFSAWRMSNPKLLGRPSMIRLIVTFSDPNGRLPEGYTAEYVFSLTY